jgi:hypothetical protein
MTYQRRGRGYCGSQPQQQPQGGYSWVRKHPRLSGGPRYRNRSWKRSKDRVFGETSMPGPLLQGLDEGDASVSSLTRNGAHQLVREITVPPHTHCSSSVSGKSSPASGNEKSEAVRPKEVSESSDPCSGNDATASPAQDLSEDECQTRKPSQRHDMKRIGSHKLVSRIMTDKKSEESATTVSDHEHVRRAGSSKLVHKSSTYNHHHHPNKGPKQRLPPHLEPASADITTPFRSKGMHSDPGSTSLPGLKAKGRHQLVSESRLQQEEDQKKAKQALKEQHMAESRVVRPVGPAKRVKLSNSEGKEERLSDFCYQKTSRKRNRGLVRLNNSDEQPICHTFARGRVCQDLKCTKRHDVPIEAATPICYFFQRQGQCFRQQECPFRHVKVNPHAMVCPQFSLLGYCQDADCKMKHVRPRPSDKTAGGG